MKRHDVAVVAFTTKGLEDVTADELRDVLGAAGRVVETGTKHVRFTTSGPLTDLRRVATADDICLLLADPFPAHTPGDLELALTEQADLPAVLDAISTLRPADGTYSITVTAARSPLGGGAAVARLASGVITRRLGWRWRENARAPVDIRVFLDGAAALVAVRLFELPLTQRDYRRVELMGSLRPTVAAAMVRLTLPAGSRHDVWDPFCGSGTVLAEAARAGHRVAGTDIDPAAVAAAKANVSVIDAAVASRIEKGDSASQSTWRRHVDADTVLTNMPWGKQVSISNASQLYDALGTGVGQLAGRGGRATVLTAHPDRLIAAARRANRGVQVAQRRIGLLGQSPSLVLFDSRP